MARIGQEVQSHLVVGREKRMGGEGDLIRTILDGSTLVGGLAGVDYFLHLYGPIRRDRADRFLHEVMEQTGRQVDDLLDAIKSDPVIGELLEAGLDAAFRTAAEEKRWHLARVVASAFSGEGLATPDQLTILLRTVAALEPADVQMLVQIARPRPGVGQMAGMMTEGAVTLEDLASLWPAAESMFEPLIAALEREGLIRTVGGTWAAVAGNRSWNLSSYGRQFLDFLPGGPYELPDLELAQLDVRFEEDGLGPVVRNLGLGTATQVVVDVYRTDAEGQAVDDVTTAEVGAIGFGEHFQLDVNPPTLGTESQLFIEVRWQDTVREQRVQVAWSELKRSPHIRFPRGGL